MAQAKLHIKIAVECVSYPSFFPSPVEAILEATPFGTYIHLVQFLSCPWLGCRFIQPASVGDFRDETV